MRHTTSLLKAAYLAFTLFCAACGNAPSEKAAAGAASEEPTTTQDNSATGTGTAKGSVAGQTLSPKSAASATYVKDGDFFLFVLSNQTDYCGAIKAGQTHANHRSLVVILYAAAAEGQSSQALGTGTYTISSEAPTNPGLYANAAFNASDASCEGILSGDAGAATSGTITLAGVTSKGLTGTYNLKFGNDTLTGSFSAPDCLALAEQADGGTTLTCEP